MQNSIKFLRRINTLGNRHLSHSSRFSPIKLIPRIADFRETPVITENSGIYCGNAQLNPDRPVSILGIGKVAAPVVETLTESLLNKGIQVSGGFISSPYQQKTELAHSRTKIKMVSGGHPIPNKNSFEGATQLNDWLLEQNETDVIVCATGGGSASIWDPKGPFSRSEIIDLNQALLVSGLPIQPMNDIRSLTCTLKNGGLIQRINQEGLRSIPIIYSDITDGDEHARYVSSGIGSNEAHRPPESITEHIEALQISALLKEKLKLSIKSKSSQEDLNLSLLKPPFIASSNQHCLKKLSASLIIDAEKKPFPLRNMSGPVDQYASYLLTQILNYKPNSNRAHLSGGELTLELNKPQLNEPGRGGRLSHLLVLLLKKLHPYPVQASIRISAVTSDGVDGSGAHAYSVQTNVLAKLNLDSIDEALNNADTCSMLEELSDRYPQWVEVSPAAAQASNVADFLVIDTP